MAPPAGPTSETQGIPPLRSVALLELTFASLLITNAPTICLMRKFPLDYLLPDYLLIALDFGMMVMYCLSHACLIVAIKADTTQYSTAMISHLKISYTIISILCLSKWIEQAGLKGFMCEYSVFCMTVIMWTVTLGMWSAIWMRGGVEGLKREIDAMPGNLWLFLYEYRRA